MEARGLRLSPTSVDCKQGVAVCKAAEQGTTEVKPTHKVVHNSDPDLKLDMDLEESHGLPGVQCWEVQEENRFPNS